MLGNLRLGIKTIKEDGLLTFLGILISHYRIPIPMSQHLMWKAGIVSEVRFWDDFFCAEERAEDLKNRLNPDFNLQEKFWGLLPPHAEVQILDVGAGPLTRIGKKCEGKQVVISAIDPLADEYERLLEKYHIQPLIRTQKGEAEKLKELFPPNSFDLVIAQNSLDHSYNPEIAIQQMINVARPGGYIYLEHFFNVAEEMQYTGMHQWNFDMSSEGDFFIRSKKTQVNISKKYANLCTIVCETTKGISRDWLIIKIIKR
jgi:SAM-dependent methyltransferase